VFPPVPAGRVDRPALRSILWLWLGAWIGAMAFFGGLTQVAFRVIPDPAVAGSLVGALLGPLLAIGALSGVALSILAIGLGRGRVTIVLPLVLATACLINQFGVSRAVAEIRLSDPDLSPQLAGRFAALHRLSVWLFVGTAAGAVVLAAAHALAEAREARGARPKR
jgi:hypothetical protein